MTQIDEMFAEIGRNGIVVDVPGAARRASTIRTELEGLLVELDEATNYQALKKKYPKLFDKKMHHFNPGSKNNINAWRFERGEKELKSVAERVIDRAFDPELGELIMDARRLRKHAGDLDTLRNHVHVDGKLHPKWTIATTFRIYAGSPNIQTMSKVTREYMIPDEGNHFWTIDWKQQELRILAYITKEPNLVSVFEEGLDPHILAFERALEVTASDDPAEREAQRDIGKMMNYALIYGLDAQGLASKIRVDASQAKSMIENYFNHLPVLEGWRLEQVERVKSAGYVETLAGTRIPVDLDQKEDELARRAVNYAIQGTGAEQLTTTLQRIKNYGANADMFSRIRATIHDALLVEVEEGDNGQLRVDWFAAVMRQPYCNIVMPTDVRGPAPNWRQAMDAVEPEPLEA